MSDEQDKGPRLNIGIIGTGRANAEFLGATGNAPITFPVTAPPIVSGPHGRAWLCDTANGQRILGVPPERDSTLAHWVIEAPWAHPIWHSYSLVLVSLRPMPGTSTMLYLDDATHELWLYAMDPNKDRNRLLSTAIVEGNWMSPGNYASQFVEIDDQLALDRVKAAVQKVCDGQLSPDTDFTSQWVALFGGNMMKDRPYWRAPKIRVDT